MGNVMEIQDYLNAQFLEREQEVEVMLTAVLAKQHALLIGPAGTGKSALASELHRCIDGLSYFQWLLTKFSTPEEVFGPLSLAGLERDEYVRNINGKLPTVHVAFLDEIFKANSAVLNALLTLINERLFYNGGEIIEAPLMTVIGASNEYPESEGLEALFDRFLLRMETNYIQSDQTFLQLLLPSKKLVVPKLTLEELEDEQFAVSLIDIPQHVLEKLVMVRGELKNEGVQASDRRYKQSLPILQARAYLHGRAEVKLADLLLLQHALWETPEQQGLVKEVLESHCLLKSEQELQTLKSVYQTIHQKYGGIVSQSISLSDEQIAEGNMQLKEVTQRIAVLLKSSPEIETEGQQLLTEIQAFQASLAAATLEIDGV